MQFPAIAAATKPSGLKSVFAGLVPKRNSSIVMKVQEKIEVFEPLPMDTQEEELSSYTHTVAANEHFVSALAVLFNIFLLLISMHYLFISFFYFICQTN